MIYVLLILFLPDCFSHSVGQKSGNPKNRNMNTLFIYPRICRVALSKLIYPNTSPGTLPNLAMTVQQKQTRTQHWASCPTLCDKCVGSLTSFMLTITVKTQIYRPYSRRLERLTICSCHCKGSTFSSVILKL